MSYLDMLSRLSDNPNIQKRIASARRVDVRISGDLIYAKTQGKKRTYKVRKNEKGDIYCTCKAFRFRDSGRSCKHILAAIDCFGVDGLPIFMKNGRRNG